MKWGIAAIVLALVAIVVVVNATRIERIKTDLVARTSKATALPEVESLLIRGESGDRIPKKAYWLLVRPSPTPGDDPEELSVATGDGSADTDAQAFASDVASRRTRYLYRADQRSIFSVEFVSGKYLVRPVSSSSAIRLVPPGMSEPRKMTLIGIPESLVTATALST